MADKRELLQQLYNELERVEATNQPNEAVLADLRARLREAGPDAVSISPSSAAILRRWANITEL